MTSLIRIIVATLALLLVAANGCGPKPVPPLPPAPSSGGASPWAGGAPSGGASPSVAGSSGAGGTSAETTSIAVVWPECNRTVKAPPKVRPPMSGWKKDKERAKRRKFRPNYLVLSEAQSVFRQPNVAKALDQLNIGRCTGGTIAQSLSTHPFTELLTIDDADKIYRRATQIDPFPGTYPPTDTGSNGASAWQAAIDLGYHHGGFVAVPTLEELQGAIQDVPCALGTDWYDGFFSPTSCGEMVLRGSIAGGHEVEIIGWDKELKRVWIRNSWGDWGVSRGQETGFAYFSAGTLQRLLNQGAEIDCPTIPVL